MQPAPPTTKSFTIKGGALWLLLFPGIGISSGFEPVQILQMLSYSLLVYMCISTYFVTNAVTFYEFICVSSVLFFCFWELFTILVLHPLLHRSLNLEGQRGRFFIKTFHLRFSAPKSLTL